MAFSRLRFPLIAASLLTLLAALWGGLVRLGWSWPALQPALPMAHGPLMVSGFLGTLIGLERAVALRKPWTYLGPVASALGSGLLIFLGSTAAGLLSSARRARRQAQQKLAGPGLPPLSAGTGMKASASSLEGE